MFVDTPGKKYSLIIFVLLLKFKASLPLVAFGIILAVAEKVIDPTVVYDFIVLPVVPVVHVKKVVTVT